MQMASGKPILIVETAKIYARNNVRWVLVVREEKLGTKLSRMRRRSIVN